MLASEIFDVSGEIAVVTGGGSGLGFAMARVLAANGAQVFLSGRQFDVLVEAAEKLRGLPGNVVPFELDVTRDEAIAPFLDQVEASAGPVSVLINNAGVAHRDKATRMSRQMFGDVMAVNVEGALMMAQAVAQRLIRKGRGGSIINISSVLSHIPMRQVVAYGASKAALSQMTRTLALEWAKYDIRVNEIRPGWYETELTEPFLRGPGKQIMAQQNPLGRLGAFHDLDGATLLLASKAGQYMTGSHITVDGGHCLGR